MKQLIYIADDEQNIRSLLKNFLSNSGYEAEAFENGEKLLAAFEKKASDLVILDIMMPGKDGLQCCEELRKTSSVPIILLTARDTELDYVQGISIGSDDYLTKPFSLTVLLMRIKALLRRMELNKDLHLPPEEMSYADLKYLKEENSIYCSREKLILTQTELRLLVYMMSNPRKAYSREELLDKVWGYETDVETRVTDETMRKIRRKLWDAGSRVIVETVWGFGYRLSDLEKKG